MNSMRLSLMKAAHVAVSWPRPENRQAGEIRSSLISFCFRLLYLVFDPDMAHRLEFSAISKQFGKQTALHPLTLSLEDGEILGFLGPNGAGKTTAIHLALGFLRPTSGSGSLLGKPFGDAEARARLGFVPDVPVFFSESGFRSVELAARLNGVNDQRLAKDIRDLLATVGLSNERKDARQYSRGMQQRLALAQALINDPELLILDEPAAALDPAGVLQVRELLRNARHAGKSIFFSSHQLTEVEHICDRIAFPKPGPPGSFRDRSRIFRASPIGWRLSCAAFLWPNSAASTPQPRPPAPTLRRSAYRFRYKNSGRVIEGVWQAGGEIMSLAPLRRRLEDLFLEWSGPAECRKRTRIDEDPDLCRRSGRLRAGCSYQNRWIYLFLMLWPFGMAAILLVPAAKPEIEDVLSIVHQECLYGLGLVAFTGGPCSAMNSGRAASPACCRVRSAGGSTSLPWSAQPGCPWRSTSSVL